MPQVFHRKSTNGDSTGSRKKSIDLSTAAVASPVKTLKSIFSKNHHPPTDAPSPSPIRNSSDTQPTTASPVDSRAAPSPASAGVVAPQESTVRTSRGLSEQTNTVPTDLNSQSDRSLADVGFFSARKLTSLFRLLSISAAIVRFWLSARGRNFACLPRQLCSSHPFSWRGSDRSGGERRRFIRPHALLQVQTDPSSSSRLQEKDFKSRRARHPFSQDPFPQIDGIRHAPFGRFPLP